MAGVNECSQEVSSALKSGPSPASCLSIPRYLESRRPTVNPLSLNNSFQKNVNANRTSFNGPNGVKAQPNAEQKAAAANAKKMPPTSQQLERQEIAKKDPNLHAKNGQVNHEAIKSFNQSHGQGKGAEGVGATGAAGAGKAGNMAGEQHAPGAAMNGEQHGNNNAAENQGNAHERQNVHGNNQNVGANHAQSNQMAEHGNAAHGQNAMNQHGMNNPGMNQHRMNQHAMNQQQMHHQQPMMNAQHQQQMAAHRQQMTAHGPPPGAHRPPPGAHGPPKGANGPHPAQPQGKKKPDKP